jgi:hypothetical protein
MPSNKADIQVLSSMIGQELWSMANDKRREMAMLDLGERRS